MKSTKKHIPTFDCPPIFLMVWQTTVWISAPSLLLVASLHSARARLRKRSFSPCRNILWLELKQFIQGGFLLCTHKGYVPLLDWWLDKEIMKMLVFWTEMEEPTEVFLTPLGFICHILQYWICIKVAAALRDSPVGEEHNATQPMSLGCKSRSAERVANRNNAVEVHKSQSNLAVKTLCLRCEHYHSNRVFKHLPEFLSQQINGTLPLHIKSNKK